MPGWLELEQFFIDIFFKVLRFGERISSQNRSARVAKISINVFVSQSDTELINFLSD